MGGSTDLFELDVYATAFEKLCHKIGIIGILHSVHDLKFIKKHACVFQVEISNDQNVIVCVMTENQCDKKNLCCKDMQK